MEVRIALFFPHRYVTNIVLFNKMYIIGYGKVDNFVLSYLHVTTTIVIVLGKLVAKISIFCRFINALMHN